jgi:septal ring factor EnvC (AmiA/AmiB activator)
MAKKKQEQLPWTKEELRKLYGLQKRRDKALEALEWAEEDITELENKIAELEIDRDDAGADVDRSSAELLAEAKRLRIKPHLILKALRQFEWS